MFQPIYSYIEGYKNLSFFCGLSQQPSFCGLSPKCCHFLLETVEKSCSILSFERIVMSQCSAEKNKLKCEKIPAWKSKIAIKKITKQTVDCVLTVYHHQINHNAAWAFLSTRTNVIVLLWDSKCLDSVIFPSGHIKKTLQCVLGWPSLYLTWIHDSGGKDERNTLQGSTMAMVFGFYGDN